MPLLLYPLEHRFSTILLVTNSTRRTSGVQLGFDSESEAGMVAPTWPPTTRRPRIASHKKMCAFPVPSLILVPTTWRPGAPRHGGLGIRVIKKDGSGPSGRSGHSIASYFCESSVA